MAGSGKVFGTSSEVYSLSRLARLCMGAISDNNQKAKSLLSQLSGSTKDEAYREAEGVVMEVSRIVAGCEEPLELVCGALEEYADFLETIGK